MAALTMVQALNLALREEMRQDPRIVVLGEDIGPLGGVFRVTEGLLDEFGETRVIDAPLNEVGIVGSALGMAMNGLRPVVEIQFADFIYPAFDQIVNELAKVRYRSGGQFEAPLVIRTPYGAGVKGGHYHSQSPEAYFVHTSGLKVVVPSTPSDAHGLLRAAIHDPDPVIFLEPKKLYRGPREEVDASNGRTPLGRARVVRQGDAATLLTYGAMVPVCMEAAAELASGGSELEVLDLRTLWPVDIEAVLESVRKTGRAVIVHEAPRTCGYGAELSALLAERAIDSLQAPVLRVTGPDTPVSYVHEAIYVPGARRVVQAVEKALAF